LTLEIVTPAAWAPVQAAARVNLPVPYDPTVSGAVDVLC
jgi:hypothetical protein